jgi:transitional endoplasmic reticulum ATPase
MTTELCPAQQVALEQLRQALPLGNVFVLYGGGGDGKTTIMRELHRELGGAFLTVGEFVNAMHQQHPLAMEEALSQIVMTAWAEEDTLFFDDLDIVYNILCSCGYNSSYPRAGFVEAALKTLAVYAGATGKRLIVSTERGLAPSLTERAWWGRIDDFKVADYAFLCRAIAGQKFVLQLDFPKIHRFAPNLNAHQLRATCLWLRHQGGIDTEGFIEHLRSLHMTSNVDLGEVQSVDLTSLKGIDEVIEALEANIILPLENDALAAELQIKPKRGVLLAGPPGTGKTTVGRALAHRLKSKFFLIDGTFISGTHDFYGKVHQVFEAAKQNAPSIIFIDDSDVIFEDSDETGLYRYLLTMLDGLESESAGRVCVMLTAMDVSSLPPALVRSGRVELWLETRLPNEAARASILQGHAANLPSVLQEIDIALLAAAAESLTGADLKRLFEDGKLLYAYDRAQGRALRPVTDYFLRAIETVRANKEKYQQAEERARDKHPSRPPWFDIGYAMTMAAEANAPTF